MSPPAVLMVVVGIILGPVYYAYCVYFTGKPEQTHILSERADRWVTDDGAIVRFRGGMGYTPLALPLSPDMNLVLLRIELELPAGVQANRAVELNHQVTLLEGDHTILERALSAQLSPGKSHSFDIGPLEIPYPTRYLLLVEEIGKTPVTPHIALEVVAKVEQANQIVVWTGLSLLIVALILQLHALWKAQRPMS
jgi:hypothetical protein